MRHGSGRWLGGVAGVCIGVMATGCEMSAPVPPSETPIDTNLVERAERIHASVLTIDTHDDIPLDFATPDADSGMRGDRQVDLPKMEEGGPRCRVLCRLCGADRAPAGELCSGAGRRADKIRGDPPDGGDAIPGSDSPCRPSGTRTTPSPNSSSRRPCPPPSYSTRTAPSFIATSATSRRPGTRSSGSWTGCQRLKPLLVDDHLVASSFVSLQQLSVRLLRRWTPAKIAKITGLHGPRCSRTQSNLARVPDVLRLARYRARRRPNTEGRCGRLPRRSRDRAID